MSDASSLDDLPQPVEETTVHPDDLQVDGQNPNEQPDEMFGLLCERIRQRGWLGGAIITDTDGLIADGEHRWRAAQEIGLDEVPVKKYDFSDTDRRMVRQELNKISGEHDTKRDALEYDLLLDAGKVDEVQALTNAANEDLDELLAEIKLQGEHSPGYEYDPEHNVYFKDCIEGMREHLDDDSVDMVFTSPPYNVDLGGSGDEHPERSGRTYYSDDRSEAEFRDFIHEVLTELVRVTKPSGHIFVNYRNDFCDKRIDIPTWLLDACPVPCRSYIVWNKKNIARSGITAPSNGRFAPSWEPIFHFSEDPSPLPSNHTFDVFDARPSSYEHHHDTGEHPAPFSVQLVEQALVPTTDEGDAVLDPFMGSGTTAVAAILNRREYVGFELDEEGAYKPIIERRIGEAKRQVQSQQNDDTAADD